MYGIERIIAGASVLWAASALLTQFVISWGGGRKDGSVKAGSPGKGVIYNFTIVMTPARKEIVRNHPMKFVIGVFMHVGIFIAVAKLLVVLVSPGSGPLWSAALGPVIVAAGVCALFLFARRVFNPEMRSISCFDDYAAILITLGLLGLVGLHEFGIVNGAVLLIYAAFFFFYMPLGKLRHALFFFIARADYGRRLGYRGIYPAVRGAKE
jgi:hypothetical protein